MKKVEMAFMAFCLAAWALALLVAADVVDLSDRLFLSPRQLFAIAAALGWVCGNILVQRVRGFDSGMTRRFWALYFFGPPGMLYLLRALAPRLQQDGDVVNFIPLLSFFVYAALFFVPVVLRSKEPQLREFKLGRDHDDE
jgi:hypothetical protein